MKQILDSSPTSPYKLVKDISSFPDDEVIAYQTAGGIWSILMQINTKNLWGFRYFDEILRGRPTCPKFEGRERQDAIRKALKCERIVFYFRNLDEFLRHIVHADPSQPSDCDE